MEYLVTAGEHKGARVVVKAGKRPTITAKGLPKAIMARVREALNEQDAYMHHSTREVGGVPTSVDQVVVAPAASRDELLRSYGARLIAGATYGDARLVSL